MSLFKNWFHSQGTDCNHQSNKYFSANDPHCGNPPHCGQGPDDPHCGNPPHCGQGPDDPHCGRPPHCGHGPRPTTARAAAVTFLENVWHSVVTGVSAVGFALITPFVWLFSHLFGSKKKKLAATAAPQVNRSNRVAYVSVYGTPCGIATYNEDLLTELRHYSDIHVFAEYADDAKTERLQSDPMWVTRCWNRKEHPKLKLIREIVNWGPDVVQFGHEYGFFAKAFYYTALVSALRMKGFPIVSTMHSVYDHLDKTVQEAGADHLIVHTEPGRVCLNKKGVSEDKITVIPHGSGIGAGTPSNPQLLPSLWNTWESDHTIYQPGFLFGYKGHLRMLGIVARLKAEFPDVHYIIQGSENPNTMAEHNWLYGKIIEECERLDITANVTLNRGFVGKDVLMAFIRTVKCVVLPYANHPEHDVRATSGVARLVMSTETPLVTSAVHLFDDLEGYVERAGDDQELYDAIKRVFTDASVRERQIEKRQAFLRKTSWPAVAYRYATVYAHLLDKMSK